MNKKYKNLKCKSYKFLFRVLPVNAWQAYIIDKHFALCPQCMAEAGADTEVDALLVSPENTRSLPPLWDGIRRELEDVDSVDSVDSGNSQDPRQAVRQSREKKKAFPILHRWQWAAAGVALLLLLLIMPFTTEKRGIPDPGPGVTGVEAEQVVVQSVMIGSKAAKYYVFSSDNPDKIIVWAQKKNDVKPNET
jgi:hypothetical protein